MYYYSMDAPDKCWWNAWRKATLEQHKNITSCHKKSWKQQSRNQPSTINDRDWWQERERERERERVSENTVPSATPSAWWWWVKYNSFTKGGLTSNYPTRLISLWSKNNNKKNKKKNNKKRYSSTTVFCEACLKTFSTNIQK